eukprot:gene17195-20455_t
MFQHLVEIFVLLYIVFFEILFAKNYLLCERANGEVLAELHWSDGLTNDECAFLNMPRKTHSKVDISDYLVQNLETPFCSLINTTTRRRRLQQGENDDSQGPSQDNPRTMDTHANVKSASCIDVSGADIASSVSINMFTIPMVYIFQDTDGYELQYVRDLDQALAQLKMSVKSSAYQTSHTSKYGGQAEDLHIQLLDSDGNVVEACGRKDSFTGYGSNSWDILTMCTDQTIEQSDCVSDFGSDLVLSLGALLEAADIDADESFGEHALRTGNSQLYSQCINRVQYHGVMGWITADTWETIKLLSSLDSAQRNPEPYPRNSSLFFLGLRYEDIAELSYDDLVVLLSDYCESASLRSFGGALDVSMTHDNMQGSRGTWSGLAGPYFPDKIHTDARVSVQLSQRVGQRYYKTSSDTGRSYYTNDMVVTVGHYGEICQFDMSVLLTTLTSALGLLAFARVITDAIMVYALPLRNLYRKEKYHVTVDYSEVRDSVAASNRAANLWHVQSWKDVFHVGHGLHAKVRRTESGAVGSSRTKSDPYNDSLIPGQPSSEVPAEVLNYTLDYNQEDLEEDSKRGESMLEVKQAPVLEHAK